jgi:hypothetical protein
MNIIDLRKNLRESDLNQRTADRRKNPHPYGSAEWEEYICQHGLNQPSHDRRTFLRRASDRRQIQYEAAQQEKPYHRILLTPAEKKLLVDIYLTDFDEA